MFRGISQAVHEMWNSIGLLCLRAGLGGMMAYGHGWGKMSQVLKGDMQFADPLGLGPAVSLMLAAGAEFICAILLIVGLLTRVAAVPLAATMAVALFIVHADDPWQRKEMAAVYLVPFLALVFTGAGRYSLDGLIWRRMWDKKK